MSEEANKELVRRYTREVFDEGRVDAVDRYLAPEDLLPNREARRVDMARNQRDPIADRQIDMGLHPRRRPLLSGRLGNSRAVSPGVNRSGHRRVRVRSRIVHWPVPAPTKDAWCRADMDESHAARVCSILHARVDPVTDAKAKLWN